MEKPPSPAGESNSEENLYKLAEERRVFRGAAESGIESIVKTAEEGIGKIKEKLSNWNIEKEGGLTKSKARLRREKTEAEEEAKGGLDEKLIEASLGENAQAYKEIKELSGKDDRLRDLELKQSFEVKTRPVAKGVYEKLLETVRKEKKETQLKLEALETKNPLEFRASELVEDAKGLYKEGHISPTKSVKEDLEHIGRNMMLGKPMFLHGPTGTGKTSLARFAAQHFTGKNPEMVYCNPQTRESAVWGKTGIRPTKGGAIETVDIYGPLAKAMNEGKVVIFDEFTALPKEQMVFIKGIFNAKVGDTVNVVGNGMTKIAPGFQMIFTANLKSEKNPERQDLPVEIAREFEQNNLKVGYVPKDESYDIMLARLMDKDGSITASWFTINETLPKLAEAIEEIQIAYAGVVSSEIARMTGSMDASGKAPGLKKFVLTQGTVEAIMLDWKVEKAKGGNVSFAEHLDKRLKIALTFEEYPLADRILAAKILASKGLLRTLTFKELNLPSDVFNFDAAKKLRGDKESVQKLKEESAKEIRIPLKELSELDPFRIRKTGAEEEARRLTEEAARRRREAGGEAGEGRITLEEAQEIMKEKFLGPEAIEKAFGFTPETIPPIPFSSEELERAKELGQFLILQVEKDEIGAPLTMKSMNEKVGGKAVDGNKLLFSIDWYRDEPFFTSESVQAGWKLVSESVIPGTAGQKNHLEQTEILISHLKTEVFQHQPLSQEYEEAIQEFEREKTGIAAIIDSDWKTAADKLASLKITDLLREKAANLLYRLIVQEKQNSQKLLSSAIYSWTKSRSSYGYFVSVGAFAAVGADVSGYEPGDRYDSLGSVFSRVK